MPNIPDQLRYSSEANKIIGQRLQEYYRACTTKELPPKLLALLKKLDEEIEASAEHVELLNSKDKSGDHANN